MSSLADGERRELLRLAREAIYERLCGRTLQVPALLDQGPPRGAFVTLRRRLDRELRGCIGQVAPSHPLARTVALTAVSAAFSDPRFPPVAHGELELLSIEISALGVPAPVEVDEIEVGLHGLIVSGRGRTGLLLPQVAEEHGWDRWTFLEWTCRKAGLPADYWKEPESRLWAFTATVFGDD